MSTIQAGVLDILGVPGMEHTYAIIDDNINFHDYWTVSTKAKDFPKPLYTPEQVELGASLPCNLYIARGLAEFGVPSRLDRTDYNHGPLSGGYMDLGDCAGIIYAYMGVCHQMCNVILCSAGDGDIAHSPVNWPNKLNDSRWVFGFRGTVHPYDYQSGAQTFERYLSSMYQDLLAFSQMDNPPTSDQMPGHFDELYAALHKDIRSHLGEQPVAQNRASHLRQLLSACMGLEKDIESFFQHILEGDHAFTTTKHELDNLLLRGQVAPQEYAEKVNMAHTGLLAHLADVFSEEEFQQVFDRAPSDPTSPLIMAELMPESYEGVKKTLGL
ncbi:hypothetical protein GTO89_10170 [Heliobacterium gestii]|uniref:Uncharacterized protein n=1 Tax=Heliomicrobium gestii TaxID=2699 RepID=A0A845LKM3_HELGE|nr:hypothetical protein [Heliomicrobium gestii]MBM7868208.1 hypothetical protein [Heliomicrobium gestii]MZP43406.1 hypothetical protein [Heliomicrobium gestii]